MPRLPFALATSCILLAGPTVRIAPKGTAVSSRDLIAITDVAVVSMLSDRAVEGQTVLVEGGRIRAVGSAARVRIPNGARRIDGRGAWLMPALTDMHVHLRPSDVPAYLANGIGTVRNMWGHDAIVRMRRAADSLGGLRIHSASAGLDGTPPQWPGTVLVTAPESAAAAVRGQAESPAGWEYIKVYSRLSPAAFDAIMREIRARRLVAVGHVPLAVDVRHALASGMRSVEHLTGYDRAVSVARQGGTWAWTDADTTRFAALVELTRRTGAWNCPTLAIYRRLAAGQGPAHEAAATRSRRHFVRLLHAAGAPVVAGSDAGIDVVPAGTSLHDELAELVAAGLSPYEALRAATVLPARFFGDSAAGTIREGANADLLLLEGNPLDDVANARRIRTMILRGRVL
ncbi:MAG TPA: amidohydrolase family protein [Gemmatimonadales bacterium]